MALASSLRIRPFVGSRMEVLLQRKEGIVVLKIKAFRVT